MNSFKLGELLGKYLGTNLVQEVGEAVLGHTKDTNEAEGLELAKGILYELEDVMATLEDVIRGDYA